MNPDYRRRLAAYQKRYLKEGGRKQHAQLWRKLALRRKLMEISPPKTIYVPFIGDGDIADELYRSCRVYGADLDLAHVVEAAKRVRGIIRVADCDAWPFADIRLQFNAADFDAWSNPYASFRSFWTGARKAKRMTLFFTDGWRQTITRQKRATYPWGEHVQNLSPKDRRKMHLGWFTKIVFPWFVQCIRPYQVVVRKFYVRGWMIYWGAVIEHA